MLRNRKAGLLLVLTRFSCFENGCALTTVQLGSVSRLPNFLVVVPVNASLGFLVLVLLVFVSVPKLKRPFGLNMNMLVVLIF